MTIDVIVDVCFYNSSSSKEKKIELGHSVIYLDSVIIDINIA